MHLAKRSSFTLGPLLLTAICVEMTGGCRSDGSSAVDQESGAAAGASGAGAEELSAYPLFTPLPSHAVIDAGHRDQPMIVADPAVYADSEGYHLLFTSVFCRPANDEAPTWRAARQGTCADVPKGATGYAFSNDRGQTWELRETPVIYARTDGWDSGDIESPFLFRQNDELVLLYAAFGRIEARFELGAATLSLAGTGVRQALLEAGLNFAPKSSPLIPANFTEPGTTNNAQEPSVIVTDDGIDVYYVAIGLTRADLGFVEGQAPTGIGLRRQRFDRHLAPIAGSDEELLPGINIAEMYAIDGGLHLYSTSMEDNDNHRGERILLHESNDDGATWSGPTEVLGFDHARFDNWGVMAPTVVIEERRAVLFFTAWEYADQPCAESDRFGMPDDESNPEESVRCLFATIGRAESAR